jgi:ornithine decarboxylase
MNKFSTFKDAINAFNSDSPIVCSHYHKSSKNIQLFLKDFPGKTFYAVKSNPDPEFVKFVMLAGIRNFDVASYNEIELVSSIADELNLTNEVHLAFMNPIKSRYAIQDAFLEYGVRDFSFDTKEELSKILEETSYATDLGLCVRVSVPKGETVYDISGGKFGANFDQSVELLKMASKYSERIGICFHVGSQITCPSSYKIAIEHVNRIINVSDIKISIFDVGGGFPAEYPNARISDFKNYFSVITNEIKNNKNLNNVELWCEPGRSIAAPSQSLIVKIMLRKGNKLYINDGVYGNLFESCGFSKQTYTATLIRNKESVVSKNVSNFELFGPTCDSVDHMPGPFNLPSDANEGDYIVLELTGAYTTCSSSNFNGFSDLNKCEIE